MSKEEKSFEELIGIYHGYSQMVSAISNKVVNDNEKVIGIGSTRLAIGLQNNWNYKKNLIIQRKILS